MKLLRQSLLVTLVTLLLAGCAGLGVREPVRVTVAGLEPLPGEGLEARFALKLRIQNPNDTAIRFDGISVDLDLDRMSFGSGVSPEAGSVDRYGETVITVPVTVPFTAIVRQVLDKTRGETRDKISYRLRGRLGGTGLVGATFDTTGELMLPGPESGAVR